MAQAAAIGSTTSRCIARHDGPSICQPVATLIAATAPRVSAGLRTSANNGAITRAPPKPVKPLTKPAASAVAARRNAASLTVRHPAAPSSFESSCGGAPAGGAERQVSGALKSPCDAQQRGVGALASIETDPKRQTVRTHRRGNGDGAKP